MNAQKKGTHKMKNIIPLAVFTLSITTGCISFTSDCECNSDCTCTKPCACNAAPNTLSKAEQEEGWKLLWDGKTLNGWVGVKNNCKTPPEKGWKIEDGVLTVLPRSRIDENGKWVKLPKEQADLGGGGDICTEKEYKDFEFKIDFRLTKSANSGIKYFYNQNKNKGTTLEYQLLEPSHPDANKGKNGNRRIASLYDLIPANADNLVKPCGEWNTAKIVSVGNRVEHYLNGVKVLGYKRKSSDFRMAVNASKYAKWGTEKDSRWGELETGRILIQDHSDSTVSFRNIKVREL
jgi:hypothetical protein